MLARALCLLISLSALTASHPSGSVQEPWIVSTEDASDDVKVPVTLGVMSRCPDALLCEAVFDQVLQKVVDKTDISLTYIGKLNTSDSTFGVTCLHGPTECAGNIQQLCVAKYRPLSVWWAYVMCQNYQTRAHIGDSDVALKCARVAGIDWETSDVGQCAGLDGSGTGEEGISLLKESVQATEALGIKKSCTILINEKQVCIRDGTWKECENGHAASDFVRQIEDEYKKLNSNLTVSPIV